MLVMQGPHPAYQTSLVLPSPEMGNTRGMQSTVQTIRAMDGTLYTYVKNKRGRKVHNWDFIVSREKALEVKAFVDLYISKAIRVIDHEDIARVGFLTLNPWEQRGDGRAGGWPSEEAYRFSLQLEEKV